MLMVNNDYRLSYTRDVNTMPITFWCQSTALPRLRVNERKYRLDVLPKAM